MRKSKVFGLLVFALVAVIMWSALNQEGIDDLEVKFVALDASRNENNTGPVVRRYLVKVNDTVWSDLERYGDLMPYTKLGKTEVFFFLEGSPMPSRIQLEGSPFETRFNEHVLAVYEKNNMGQVSLKKID